MTDFNFDRTQTIRWRFVVSHAIQFVVVVLLIYLSICRILIDNYSSTGHESFNSQQIFPYLTTVFVFGIILFFLIFYGFLHLWHNLTAELLRFGDRHFYEAWWVSASFKEYYRKWNLLVQEWLFTYVYYPVYNWSHSRVTAQYATIVFSGLAHEYILFHSTKFFFPLLFFNFAIGGCKWLPQMLLLTKNELIRLHIAQSFFTCSHRKKCAIERWPTSRTSSSSS